LASSRPRRGSIGAASFNVTTSAFSVFAGGPLKCEPGFPVGFRAFSRPVSPALFPNLGLPRDNGVRSTGWLAMHAVGYTFIPNSNSVT
jgi:hypothetical protein